MNIDSETRYERTPVVGYSEGRIVSRASPARSVRGNLYFVIGETVYDVHPYRADLGGYPVRWSESLATNRASGY